MLTVSSAAADPIKLAFLQTETGLHYEGTSWSMDAEKGKGWTSLKVCGGEYLAQSEKNGGIVMVKGGKFITYFPDCSNMSHDASFGRIGMACDGVNMIKISPDWYRPGFELYLGANEKEEQQAVMLFGDDVKHIALSAGDSNRAWEQRRISRTSKGLSKTREALVVHGNGTSMSVRSVLSPGKDDKGKDIPPPEFSAGMLESPDGKACLALVFPCRGFAQNSYKFSIDPEARAENFVMRPKFDVISSDDPKGNSESATHGAVNPVYGKDTAVDFGIDFEWTGSDPFEGFAELEITHSLGKRHYYQRADISGPAPDKDGKIRIKFSPKFTMPGVSEVVSRLYDKKGNLIWTDRYRMAYDWENYRPSIQVEPDFNDFWDGTLKQLRAAPLDAKTERVKEFYDHPKFEIYDVTFNGWDNKIIHAMMFVPKDARKPLPAIVTAHPGITGFGVNRRPDGVYGSELKQDPRFVTIIPLIRGHAPDEKDIPFNHPWWGPLGDRDNYVARSWYCALVRTVDYLATRADLVDMNRIVASGGSQGGAFSLVLAGLDPRIAVCISDCPAVCQPNEIMENYPSFGPSKGQVPEGKTLKDVEQMLSYYNPVNFCPRIKCPTYVGSNIGDLTVHSMGPLAAFQNLSSLKGADKAFYPGFPRSHGSGPGLWAKSKEILEKLSAQ